MNAEELAGSLLVVGFEGSTLPKALQHDLEKGTRGGCVCFRRNLPSLEETAALTNAIIASSGQCAFIAIDQEGGRVERMPNPFPHLPPARTLASVGRDGLVTCGRLLGQALSAFGFSMDFAPVLDVDSIAKSPIIGDRAFSDSPSEVARLAGGFSEGLISGGVASCGKHFPGHGHATVDSHLGLPLVGAGRELLMTRELLPFHALSKAVPALMTAHIRYPALDAEHPATLSRRISTDLLRGELGFDGVLFSDDLEMGAVFDDAQFEARCQLAVEAGCDVLLICRSPELAERASRALSRRIDADPNFAERARTAHARFTALKHRFGVAVAPPSVREEHRLRLAQWVETTFGTPMA